MLTFKKESDKKGTYIIEGEEKEDQVFSIKRFICQVQDQGSNEKTQEVADLLLSALAKAAKWDALEKEVDACYFLPDGEERPDDPDDEEYRDLTHIGEVTAKAFGIPGF
jgi:hypothetical protein